VSEAFLQDLFYAIEEDPASPISVDLEKEIITNEKSGKSEQFEINAYKKMCLMNGYDDIDYILSGQDTIKAFEAQRRIF
jgi:3-isopropylmalate/(R)-2-methylmalate dehydratase small subunit